MGCTKMNLNSNPIDALTAEVERSHRRLFGYL